MAQIRNKNHNEDDFISCTNMLRDPERREGARASRHVAELQRAVEQTYRSGDIYTNPTITVTVPTVARFVNVSGDVRQPRRVEYTQDLTVLGAISASGGFTEYADQRKVRLLRRGKVTIIDVKAVRGNPELDITLLPGDQIEVPQSWW